MATVVKLAPEFSWKRMLWKAVRPAITAAVIAFAATATEQIRTEDLTNLGIPAIIAIALQEGLRNYGKQHGWWGKR